MAAAAQEPVKTEYLPASASGRRWALGFGIVVMLATTIPYWLAYQSQGDAWLFRSPYTPMPQAGVVAYLPYILLGKLAAPHGMHVQLVVIYHLFRIAAGCMAVVATYDFLAYFLHDERVRRFGVALAALGGGLGWILVAWGDQTWLGSLPLDFYSPEAFGFLALYGFPHLAALLWGLLGYLNGIRPGAPGASMQVVITGVWWLFAALFQPLTALVMGMVIAFYVLALVVRQGFSQDQPTGAGTKPWLRALRHAALSALIPAPFFLYYMVRFSTDSYLQAWTAQNLILSPHIAHYLIAYGLLLPFTISGARRLLHRIPDAGWLPTVWVLAAPLLAYAPVNIQRRLVDGVWVAVIVLAGSAVQRDFGSQNRWRLFLTAAIFAFPSTILSPWLAAKR